MKGRTGILELFIVAILVTVTALVGYYIYKVNQVHAPRVEQISIETAVPPATEISSPADVGEAINTVDQLDLDASLKQLDALDEDVRS